MSKLFDKQTETYEKEKIKWLVDGLNSVGCDRTEFAKKYNVSRSYIYKLCQKYKIKTKLIAYVDQ